MTDTSVEVVEDEPVLDAIPVDEPESDQPEEVAEKPKEPEKEPKEEETEPSEPKSKKRTARDRINELTADKRSLERRTERLEEMLAGQIQPKPQVQPETAPKQDDFENYDEFLVAKAKHEVRQEVRTEFEAQNKRNVENQQNLRARDAAQTFNTKAVDARAKYDDFDEVAFSNNVAITDTMTEVIVQSDKGPDVAYHLGSHPETAARIASLSPVQQAVELGKIEASLDPPKKTTSAPEPVKTVSKGNAGLNKSPEKMSYDEYKKWRMGDN